MDVSTAVEVLVVLRGLDQSLTLERTRTRDRADVDSSDNLLLLLNK